MWRKQTSGITSSEEPLAGPAVHARHAGGAASQKPLSVSRLFEDGGARLSSPSSHAGPRFNLLGVARNLNFDWDTAGILACLWWATQSVALVLANKAVFSQPLFDYPWLIITIQCVVVVFAFSLVAVVRREPPAINLTQITNMLVPSTLFLLYHYSNARSLRFISLPAFTVVKSLAPIGVTTVERIAFGNSIPSGVYAAMALSLLANVFTFDSASAISETSLLGYAWSCFNVTTHIFYVLALRYCAGSYKATDKAFVANLLSIPIAFMFSIANQEIRTFSHEVTLLPSSARVPLVLSFALSAGCLVSVLSAFEAASSDALRYLAQTNKIAIVLLGAAIFQTKFTPHAWFGVFLAVVSGFCFVYAKSKSHNTALGIPRPIVSSPTLELLLPTEDRGQDEYFNNRGKYFPLLKQDGLEGTVST